MLTSRNCSLFDGMQHVTAGDGANDVNMIQAADIGIGISGQEGMQVRIKPFTQNTRTWVKNDLMFAMLSVPKWIIAVGMT